jgi:hypothetical protein
MMGSWLPALQRPGDLESLGGLAEHRIDDADEGVAAVEQPAPAGQQIALEPAFALALAQHRIEHVPSEGVPQGSRIDIPIGVDSPLALGRRLGQLGDRAGVVFNFGFASLNRRRTPCPGSRLDRTFLDAMPARVATGFDRVPR